MNFPIFLSSLGFIGFFLWYLAAENAPTRRAAGGLAASVPPVVAAALVAWAKREAMSGGMNGYQVLVPR